MLLLPFVWYSSESYARFSGFFFAGEFVAQFKVTVILMPNGPLKITGLPFEPEAYQTEYKIEDEDVKVRHNRSLAVGQSLLLCIFGICL